VLREVLRIERYLSIFDQGDDKMKSTPMAEMGFSSPPALKRHQMSIFSRQDIRMVSTI
jgi:hypothetical protein